MLNLLQEQKDSEKVALYKKTYLFKLYLTVGKNRQFEIIKI